jgi:hypothetical protein
MEPLGTRRAMVAQAGQASTFWDRHFNKTVNPNTTAKANKAMDTQIKRGNFAFIPQ